MHRDKLWKFGKSSTNTAVVSARSTKQHAGLATASTHWDFGPNGSGSSGGESGILDAGVFEESSSTTCRRSSEAVKFDGFRIHGDIDVLAISIHISPV